MGRMTRRAANDTQKYKYRGVEDRATADKHSKLRGEKCRCVRIDASQF